MKGKVIASIVGGVLSVGGFIALVVASEKKEAREKEIYDNEIIECCKCGKKAKRKDFQSYYYNNRTDYYDAWDELSDEIWYTELEGKQGQVCEGCRFRIASEVHRRLDKASNVVTVSKNYEGNKYKNIIEQKEPLSLNSYYHIDKLDALEDLKIYAAYNNCKYVLNVYYDYENRWDGNYCYKVWCAMGEAY